MGRFYLLLASVKNLASLQAGVETELGDESKEYLECVCEKMEEVSDKLDYVVKGDKWGELLATNIGDDLLAIMTEAHGAIKKIKSWEETIHDFIRDEVKGLGKVLKKPIENP